MILKVPNVQSFDADIDTGIFGAEVFEYKIFFQDTQSPISHCFTIIFPLKSVLSFTLTFRITFSSGCFPSSTVKFGSIKKVFKSL